MRILRPVVQTFVQTMRGAWHGVAFCCAVGSQLVRGRHDARSVPLLGFVAANPSLLISCGFLGTTLGEPVVFAVHSLKGRLLAISVAPRS